MDLMLDKKSPDANTDKSPDVAKPQSYAARGNYLGGVPVHSILKLIVPVAIIIGAFMGYGYLSDSKPKPKKPKIVERSWPIDVMPAKFASVTPTMKLFGKTVANRQVELRALVSGKIIEVGPSMKEGALVKKGELLVKIDDFDYKGAVSEAEANLNEAKAKLTEMSASINLEQQNLQYAEKQLGLANKDYKRASNLSKRGTVTKKLADDREVVVTERKQAVSTSTMNLELWSARKSQQEAIIKRLDWKLSQAHRRLEETALVAPFGAYVNSVNAELGRTMSINDRVAMLIDQEKIDVRFVLSDAQYGRLIADNPNLTGRKIKLLWRVGDKPIEYTGKIARTGALISAEAGGVEIYATLDDPKLPVPIRVGAFVEVHLDDRNYKNVIRIPQAALYESDKIYSVENGRLEAVNVTVVGVAGNDILVIGNVPENTPILTSRITVAGEGLKVNSQRSTPGAPLDDAKKKQFPKKPIKHRGAAKGL